MTSRFTGILILATALLAGCAAQPLKPQPGASCVVLNIGAQPKAGLKKHIDRVPVYDAAPTSAKATGEFEHVDYESLDDIIVWLEPLTPPPAGSVPTGAMILGLYTGASAEQVHPAWVGEEITFHNTGPTPLSLYSVSDGNEFDLPAIPSGGIAKYTIRGEGLIEILGDPAQPPVALVYAVPSPWVASAKSGQHVVFNNVPPGSYRAVGWHPRLPGKTVDVTLAPNQIVHESLAISVNNLSAVAMVEP